MARKLIEGSENNYDADKMEKKKRKKTLSSIMLE